MRGAVLVVVFVTMGTAPVSAQSRRETHDVPWFQARPQILDDTLRRCHRDARLAASWDCQNAEAAGASRLGQTAPRTSPAKQAPVLDKSGLPEPDFNPHTNPFGFQSLKRACAERGPGSEMLTSYCGQLDRYRQERDRAQ
jgi:hypothetical protein